MKVVVHKKMISSLEIGLTIKKLSLTELKILNNIYDVIFFRIFHTYSLLPY